MSDTQMTAQDFLAVRERLAVTLRRNAGRSQVNTTALAEALLTAGYADVEAILRELYPERYVDAVPWDRLVAEFAPAAPDVKPGPRSVDVSASTAEPKPLTLPDVEALAEDAAAGDGPPNRGCPNAYRAAPGEIVQCTRPLRYLGGVREHQNHRDGDPASYSTATVKWTEGDPDALVWHRGAGWVSPAEDLDVAVPGIVYEQDATTTTDEMKG